MKSLFSKKVSVRTQISYIDSSLINIGSLNLSDRPSMFQLIMLKADVKDCGGISVENVIKWDKIGLARWIITKKYNELTLTQH